MDIDIVQLCASINTMVRNTMRDVMISSDGKNIVYRNNMYTTGMDDDIFENSILPNDGEMWINRPIFPNNPLAITKLNCDSSAGFNYDTRSHRGDHVCEDPNEIVHSIPVDLVAGYYHDTPTDLFLQLEFDDVAIWENSNHTDFYEIKNKYLKWADIDAQIYCPYVEIENSNGLTWGDLMYGFMMAKGSKTDLWYELFMDVEDVEIEGDTLNVTFGFEHGS